MSDLKLITSEEEAALRERYRALDLAEEQIKRQLTLYGDIDGFRQDLEADLAWVRQRKKEIGARILLGGHTNDLAAQPKVSPTTPLNGNHQHRQTRS